MDAETSITVKQMFGLKKADDINMANMQCQKGNKDCGLFAIAVMTYISLGFGEDLSTVNYDQDIKRHLVDCITNRVSLRILAKGGRNGVQWNIGGKSGMILLKANTDLTN